MSFYGKMQGLATKLINQFKQGTVTITRITTTPNGTEPWNATDGSQSYDLAATVSRVEQKYIDGTLIVGTENQITFAVPPITPTMGDTFALDGVVMTLKDLRPIPPVGTPVAYIAFAEV